MCETATEKLIDIEETENLEKDSMTLRKFTKEEKEAYSESLKKVFKPTGEKLDLSDNETKSKFHIDFEELTERCVDKYLDNNYIKSGELSVSNLLHIDGIYDAFRFMKRELEKE